MCPKFYLLFFPEFPKNFSYYSFFILVPSLLFHNNAHLVSLAIVAYSSQDADIRSSFVRNN